MQLLQKLNPTRFEQRFVCKETRGPLSELFYHHDASITVLPGSWRVDDLQTIDSLMRLIQEWQPHIIHGAVFEGCMMATLAGYLSGVPVRIVEETGATPQRSVRGDFLMAMATLLSDRCIAVSPHVARYLTRRSSLAHPKLKTITNGVSAPPLVEPALRDAVKRELQLPDDCVIIGSIGRVFNQHKRFSDLIEALHLLVQQEHNVGLVIIGDGPDLEQLRTLARALHVQDRVSFVGRTADVGRYLSVMDIFAMCSAYEAFGLVLAEAMSAALPVVAARVDAFPDIVEEGVTGLLVPPQNPKALAHTLATLVQQPERRRAMGAAGLTRYEQLFHEERYIQEVAACYEELWRSYQSRA